MPKLLRSIFILICLFAATGSAFATSPDAKSAKIYVAGNPRFMSAHGFNGRFTPVETNLQSKLEAIPNKSVCQDLAKQLENEHAGTQILKCLTDNFTTMPADGKQDFSNCYIVLTYTHEESNKKGDKNHTPYYALFHVEVTPETAGSIRESIASGNAPAAIGCHIVPVSHGKAVIGRTLTSISRSIPELTAGGQLLKTAPPTINFGANAGVKKGDLISIYAKDDTDENPKRLSCIRITQIWDFGASGFYEDRKLTDANIGDRAERTLVNPIRFGAMATYAKNNWGAQFIMDAKLGFSPSGLGHHLLANVGFSIPTHRSGELIYPPTYFKTKFKSFMYYNIGIAYGMSILIAGSMEAMPFAGVQYDGSTLKMDPIKSGTLSGESADKIQRGSNIRIPIGLRYSFNLKYPIKFFVEAGYAITSDIGTSIFYINLARKNVNVDRSGLFVNAGFSF